MNEAQTHSEEMAILLNLILLGSTRSPSNETMWPRNSSSGLLNSDLESLAKNLCFRSKSISFWLTPLQSNEACGCLSPFSADIGGLQHQLISTAILHDPYNSIVI